MHSTDDPMNPLSLGSWPPPFISRTNCSPPCDYDWTGSLIPRLDDDEEQIQTVCLDSWWSINAHWNWKNKNKNFGKDVDDNFSCCEVGDCRFRDLLCPLFPELVASALRFLVFAGWWWELLRQVRNHIMTLTVSIISKIIHKFVFEKVSISIYSY